MKGKLTKKQLGFANDYLETGNASEAVRRNYKKTTNGTVKSIGSENLSKPDIMAYLQSKAQDVAANIYKLALNAESEQVQLGAGKDILDRAGFKPIEKSDITTGGEKLPYMVIPFRDEPTTKNSNN